MQKRQSGGALTHSEAEAAASQAPATLVYSIYMIYLFIWFFFSKGRLFLSEIDDVCCDIEWLWCLYVLVPRFSFNFRDQYVGSNVVDIL